MGKRVLSPGVKYLQSIHFTPVGGRQRLLRSLTKTFGEEKASEILGQVLKVKDRSLEFYELLNADPEISRCYSESYEGDFIKNGCNFISDHKEWFGKSILEVGCGAGYTTGFLAQMFPDARIVAIDRSANAIRIARERLGKMGIQNVEFQNCSPEELDEKFDTVLTMRTVRENWISEKEPFFGEPVVLQFKCYKEITEKYTEALLTCLSENGSLIAFERMHNDPLLCGWWLQLNDKKCSPVLETRKRYFCEEAGEEIEIQAFLAKRGLENKCENILHFWYEAIEVDPTDKMELEGWNALVYLQDHVGRLIRGIYILSDKGKVLGRHAVFTDEEQDDLLYCLDATGGRKVRMAYFHSSLINELDNRLQQIIEINEIYGFSYREIDVEKDIVERVMIDDFLM